MRDIKPTDRIIDLLWLIIDWLQLYNKENRVWERAKSKNDFSHLSHSIMKHHINIETNFDLKIKVEGPLKIERPTWSLKQRWSIKVAILPIFY